MPQNKRYHFTFTFTFDGKVERRFVPEFEQLCKAKLQKLGYEVAGVVGSGGTQIFASKASGQLLDFNAVSQVALQELLHYELNSVTVLFANTLIPSPNQKQERLNDFKYRNGEWWEEYKRESYHFKADVESKILLITTSYKKGENKYWAEDLLHVLKSVQHSAFLAKQFKQFSYSMRSDDENFMVASQGKMMSSIAFKLV